MALDLDPIAIATQHALRTVAALDWIAASILRWEAHRVCVWLAVERAVGQVAMVVGVLAADVFQADSASTGIGFDAAG